MLQVWIQVNLLWFWGLAVEIVGVWLSGRGTRRRRLARSISAVSRSFKLQSHKIQEGHACEQGGEAVAIGPAGSLGRRLPKSQLRKFKGEILCVLLKYKYSSVFWELKQEL
ncbi:hypothetical protein B0F90DRAFT_1672022 [Multifurca ochricompacta]|uniref:Uncharacterized protein n=1 Tax=Multifurca ochricompacta TaxID=376703 RepID=A0AAD4LUX5_9AGAM|nr:hypothetical protein B0F90DRAFT_1672022 [Multifurca ochricompacta]